MPRFRAALLAAACLSSAAGAQPRPHHPSVQPISGTPEPTYRNVFVDTPTGVETGRVDWRRANENVAQFPRGHADLLRWEERQMPPEAATPRPTAPGHDAHGGSR